MKIFYDEDANLEIIKNLKVAIIGYGSQGHAHANNLHDSGVDITVGLREGSTSWDKAESAGLKVSSVEDSVKGSDFVMILAPDEFQSDLYTKKIESNLKQGVILAFAHGFNIHFGKIKPTDDISVVMIAPKGPGHTVRSTYMSGGGVPSLIAIYRDSISAKDFNAKDVALSYAKANGGTRAGVLETSFREETETDLFGEQAVLCGGVSELVKTAFDVLVEGGYEPESAYFEVLHELKLIVDLMYQGGLEHMRYSISETAEYGDYSRGPVVIDENVKKNMQKVLEQIQSGEFAREWIAENDEGLHRFKQMREQNKEHGVEKVGKELRSMMPWLESTT